jgi:hypothetical protein
MQRLAVYTGEALQELEDAMLPKAITAGKAPRRKAAQAAAAPARKRAAPTPAARKVAPPVQPESAQKPAARRKAKAGGASAKTAAA